MLKIMMTAAVFLGTTTLVTAQDINCAEGAQVCSTANLGDKEINSSQDIGDHINPVYAPDSASASSSANIGNVKAVAQGGAADSKSSATGNLSNNDNKSSANNALTFGSEIANTNSNANVAGFNNADSFVGTNAQGQGQGQNQVATGGKASGGKSASQSRSNSGGNTMKGSNVRIDNSQHNRQAAASAATVIPGGYGPGNCFGDTNPSGSFGMSVQIFGGGAAANRMKASNVCAAVALGGREGGVTYLAVQDPMFHKAMRANGQIVTSEELARRRAVHESKTAPVVCPQGSTFDGQGCWADNVKKVRR